MPSSKSPKLLEDFKSYSTTRQLSVVEREETVPPGYTSNRNYYWVLT